MPPTFSNRSTVSTVQPTLTLGSPDGDGWHRVLPGDPEITSRPRTSLAPIIEPVPSLDGVCQSRDSFGSINSLSPSFLELGVPVVLAEALAAAGISNPFPIQTATLPDSLAGRDVLGQGRTGSGKTLAFALPLITHLVGLPRKPHHPAGLVLVPTRELATQVATTLAPLARAVGLEVTTVFGGVGPGPQRAAFARGVQILVACPGRLADHLQSGAVSLDQVRVTVLDEADHMADQGFLPTVRKLLDATPADGQRLLFSATLAGGVGAVVDRYLTNPVSHAVAVEAPAALEHRVRIIDEETRLAELVGLVANTRAVVFTRTKHRAKTLARKLVAAGVPAVELHGNLAQNARERNLAAFSSGAALVLVATDIAARGIHVDEVPLVVHADPPIEEKAYLHRSGRTARAGAAGQVVTLVSLEQLGELDSVLARAHITAAFEGILRPTPIRSTTSRSTASRPVASRPPRPAHRRSQDGRQQQSRSTFKPVRSAS